MVDIAWTFLLGLVCAGAAVLAAMLAVFGLIWLFRGTRGVRRLTPRRESGQSTDGREDHQAAPVTSADLPRTQPRCPTCGSELPPGSPQGLCPRCLLQVAIEPAQPDTGTPQTAAYLPGVAPLSVQELAARFPQLEILDLLGQGGMGAVYKARQPHLDRFVALKILPPDAARDPAFAERFGREARALARLSHPNIVAVHDFGQSDGLYWLLMEYVDGVNLRQAMRAGELTPEGALRIVPQLCDALQFAHDEGIVHRDIKPENILLDRRGRVKVADFGLAKLLGQSAADSGLTGTQQVMGTLHYMAPEQLAGSRAVDHRADIYSLGVTFYEMLTGDLPLGHFPLPSKTAAVDARLDPVVLRTLEREPEARYQHASDVKLEVEWIARAPRPMRQSTTETQPALLTYAIWVGCPTILFFGIFVVITTLAFVSLGANKDTVPGALVGAVVLALLFGALNLAWFLSGRRRSAGQRRSSAAPPARADDRDSSAGLSLARDEERQGWWRRRSSFVRNGTKTTLLVAMLGFSIGFASPSGWETAGAQGKVSVFEIGAFQPWFVWEKAEAAEPAVNEPRVLFLQPWFVREANGFRLSTHMNFLSLSAGFGVLAFVCLQGLIVIYRLEKRSRRPKGLATYRSFETSSAVTPIADHSGTTTSGNPDEGYRP